MDSSALPNLLEVLDLDRVDQGVYVGRPSEDGRNRVFGGHTISQALAAACFSVDGMPCHSMHAYFVRPGLPGRPTQYEVSAIRDGNSFATRQVVAVQRDEVVLTLSASFHRATEDEAAFSYSIAPPVAGSPDTFPDEAARTERLLQSVPPDLRDLVRRRMPVETIRVDDFAPLPVPEQQQAETFQRTRPSRVWMRARTDMALPDDDNFHRCAFAYASDAGPLEPCMRAAGASFGDNGLQVASLDHSIWFHRPLRFDDWLLFVFESAVVAEGRALSRGSVFDQKRVLVASIAQEGVVRKRA
jgi:acyl-CoA thioesterase-2